MAIQTRRQSLTQARLLFNQQGRGARRHGRRADPAFVAALRRPGFRHARPAPAEPLTQAELREAASATRRCAACPILSWPSCASVRTGRAAW